MVAAQGYPSHNMSNNNMNAESSSDHSSSEDEAELLTDEQQEELFELIEKAKNNPLDYDSQYNCVATLSSSPSIKSILSKELLNARELFSSNFPMTPDLWVNWLSDSPEEGLFKKALDDYLSCTIWLLYLDSFPSIELFDIAADGPAGHHYTEGYLIWKAYREFVKNRGGSNDDSTIANVYIKQLKNTVQSQASEVLGEFKAWISFHPNIVDPSVMTEIQNSVDSQSSIRTQLDAIFFSIAESPSFEKIDNLLAVVGSSTSSTRISAYEVAVANTCLHVTYWQQYIEYLFFDLKDVEQALSVSTRALRNLQSSSILYKYNGILNLKAGRWNYEKCMSEWKAGLLKVQDKSVLAISMLQLCYSNNDVDEWKQLLAEFKNTTFKTTTSSLIELTTYELQCPFTADKKGVALDLQRLAGEYYYIWNLSLPFFNDVSTKRQMFHDALKKVKDYPKELCNLYLSFESHSGSFVDGSFEDAQRRVREILKEQQRSTNTIKKPQSTEKPAKRKTMANAIHKQKKKSKSSSDVKNLFVSNLTSQVTSADLEKVFQKYGTISKIEVKAGKSKGNGGGGACAFVEYISTYDNLKDVFQKPIMLYDKVVKVAYGKQKAESIWKLHPKTLYVGLCKTFKDVNPEFFSSHFGKNDDVQCVFVARDLRNDSLKGYVLVEFKSKEKLEAVMKSQSQYLIQDKIIELKGSRASATEMLEKQSIREKKFSGDKKKKKSAPRVRKAPAKRLMVPRGVKKQEMECSDTVVATTPDAVKNEEMDCTEKATAASTNDDFRKMFLSK